MIGAIVLAAGLSKRMGSPKMILPWGDSTVIERVVTVLDTTGVTPIVVVTGGAKEQVERQLSGRNVQIVFNPVYQNGEMLSSIQVGLRSLPETCEAALISLGDQPQINVETVRGIIEEYHNSGRRYIIPSYQMRRGHPWLIQRDYWTEILEMSAPETMRDFLRKHEDEIQYLVVENSSILQDLDTPEDYAQYCPKTTPGK